MEKRIYVKPELELLEFTVEAGFAQSIPAGHAQTADLKEDGGDGLGWEIY